MTVSRSQMSSARDQSLAPGDAEPSAAFTPGPWVVNPARAWVEAADDLAALGGAPICAACWPTPLRSEAETYANAHLIAAAPALYEALTGLISHAEMAAEHWDECPYPDVLRKRLDAARAALRQANGAS